jgi:hypothetical protein
LTPAAKASIENRGSYCSGKPLRHPKSSAESRIKGRIKNQACRIKNQVRNKESSAKSSFPAAFQGMKSEIEIALSAYS